MFKSRMPPPIVQMKIQERSEKMQDEYKFFTVQNDILKRAE
jgi:hypothetical protein